MIVIVSVWYSNQLAQKIAEEEQKNIQLWAKAYQYLNSASENTNIGFLSEVIANNTSVPVILTDELGNIISYRNLGEVGGEDSSYLYQQLNRMKQRGSLIEIKLDDTYKNYIYYSESFLLRQLKYYPYIQLSIISIYLLVAYLAFSNSRRSEQNKVWVGMAKETAHQLGTPLSSLMAWMEYLSTKGLEERVVKELNQDVDRLKLITERFSKIGSNPDLMMHDLQIELQRNIDYIRKRSSDKVSIQFESNLPDQYQLNYNPPLFNWVLENLLKNALDSIDGEGSIVVRLQEESKYVNIDVSDTGKGISRKDFKTVFNPGFSTKKRGWGLGLSLAKRIIENYHRGKIFVKESVLNKGTTFRIQLPK